MQSTQKSSAKFSGFELIVGEPHSRFILFSVKYHIFRAMSIKNILHYNFIVIQYCSNVSFMIYLQNLYEQTKESFVMTGQTIGLLLVMIIYLILMVGIGVLYSKKNNDVSDFIWVAVNSGRL